MSRDNIEKVIRAPKGYELDGVIVAVSYVQSFFGHTSIFCLGTAVVMWLTHPEWTMVFAAIGLLSTLLYWFLDSFLGDFKSSGATNRVQIIQMNKRLSKLEKVNA